MVASSVYVLKVSCSCPFPLQDTLLDKQVSLTQASIKLLFLLWDLELVRFCVCPLRVMSLFPHLSLLQWNQKLSK